MSLWKWHRGPVELCERCGSVCDGACRRKAVVGQIREKAVLHRMRAL